MSLSTGAWGFGFLAVPSVLPPPAAASLMEKQQLGRRWPDPKQTRKNKPPSSLDWSGAGSPRDSHHPTPWAGVWERHMGALTQSCLECRWPLGLFVLSVARRAAVLTGQAGWQMGPLLLCLAFNLGQCWSPRLLTGKAWPIASACILARREATRPPSRRSSPAREKRISSWHSTLCQGEAALTPWPATQQMMVVGGMCRKWAPSKGAHPCSSPSC